MANRRIASDEKQLIWVALLELAKKQPDETIGRPAYELSKIFDPAKNDHDEMGMSWETFKEIWNL